MSVRAHQNHPIRRALVALCAIALLVGASTPAFSAVDEMASQLPDENATSNPVVDALILRPLGFVALLHGVAFFAPAAVLTAATRPTEMGKILGALIIDPARYIWVDPLGEH